MYKIGLCGAGGTGKGTFGKKLAEVLEEKGNVLLAKLYASPVQRVGRTLFPQAKNFADFSPEEGILYQYAILGAQTELELNADEEGVADVCIFERTFFDYLAYTRGLNEAWQEEYEDTVLNAYYKDPYDIIFYFPADDFVPQDTADAAWKERDQESRKKTDRILQDILFKEDLAEHSMIFKLAGSLDQRANKAIHILCRRIFLLV